LKFLQEEIANLEKSIDKIANPTSWKCWRVHHIILWDGQMKLWKTALQIRSANGVAYKGKLWFTVLVIFL